MKNLLLASSLIFSATAFAIDSSSSWSEINASYKTDVRAPQVGFAAGEATTFYTIFETCVDGDMIKTIEAKDIFTQINHGKENTEIVVVGQEVLSHLKSYVVMMPVGNHGLETKAVTITIPVQNNIEVYEKVQTKNGEGRKLFTKSFSIPVCK
jgi:hypothetical protein